MCRLFIRCCRTHLLHSAGFGPNLVKVGALCSKFINVWHFGHGKPDVGPLQPVWVKGRHRPMCRDRVRPKPVKFGPSSAEHHLQILDRCTCQTLVRHRPSLDRWLHLDRIRPISKFHHVRAAFGPGMGRRLGRGGRLHTTSCISLSFVTHICSCFRGDRRASRKSDGPKTCRDRRLVFLLLWRAQKLSNRLLRDPVFAPDWTLIGRFVPTLGRFGQHVT